MLPECVPYHFSRANLKSISKAGSLKIEDYFHNKLVPFSQAFTDFKLDNFYTCLCEELNNFFARFNQDSKETPFIAELLPNDQPLILAFNDKCSILSKVNAPKVAGPDGQGVSSTGHGPTTMIIWYLNSCFRYF